MNAAVLLTKLTWNGFAKRANEHLEHHSEADVQITYLSNFFEYELKKRLLTLLQVYRWYLPELKILLHMVGMGWRWVTARLQCWEFYTKTTCLKICWLYQDDKHWNIVTLYMIWTMKFIQWGKIILISLFSWMIWCVQDIWQLLPGRRLLTEKKRHWDPPIFAC